MKNTSGGSAQSRRRARRAAMRAHMNPAAVARAESADLQAISDLAASATDSAPVAELAPEDAALERLDAALAETLTERTATVSLTVSPEAMEEATVVLTKGLQISDGGTATTMAAATDRFQRAVTFALENFELMDAVETVVPAVAPGPEAPAPIPSGATLHWRSEITFEATLTDDGRAFAPDAIAWRDLPLTLGAMLDTPHADTVTEARACGRIDRIWRDGNILRAEGVFDTGEFGQEIGRMVTDKVLTGVSVDTVINSYEVGPRSQYFDPDGNWIDQSEAPEDGEQDLVDLLFGDEGGDTIFVITSATIGAVTICPFAAFADAKISVGDSLVAGATPGVWTITQQAGFVVTAEASELVASAAVLEQGEEAPPAEPAEETLTASAAGLAPVAPPAEWFQDPGLEEPTALVVTDEGRIFGHAWLWDTCHTGIPGVCTTAPASQTGYAVFLVGEMLCEDGERVAVGRITFDTGHAAPGLSRAAAAAHYDHTGKVGAYVVVGEDEHGGWVAGTLAADVTAEDAQKLRGAAPSGDWRNVNGNLELVASADGFAVESLTAAGLMFQPDESTLFEIGLTDAVRSGEMTQAEAEALAGAEGEVFALWVERGREALETHRQEQTDAQREMAALAAMAHGEFDGLAAAAHEA